MLYKIIDSVISEKYSQYIFDQVVQLNWKFVPNLSYGLTDNYNAAGFSYNFYLDKNYNKQESTTIKSNEYFYIIPLLLEAFDKFGLNLSIDNIFRSRARLTLNKETSLVEDKHIDYTFPHLVLLYYVNTTDGDTILFDQNKIVEKISPKRGRCVLFDGSMLHASSSSTLSPRIVINNNINYK